MVSRRTPPGGFKGAFESENHKKSPCGRGAIWGVKTQKQLRCAEMVDSSKISLNDFFKLIKGTFHLLGSVLSDLKGGCGFIFCVADFALIAAFFVR